MIVVVISGGSHSYQYLAQHQRAQQPQVSAMILSTFDINSCPPSANLTAWCSGAKFVTCQTGQIFFSKKTVACFFFSMWICVVQINWTYQGLVLLIFLVLWSWEEFSLTPWPYTHLFFLHLFRETCNKKSSVKTDWPWQKDEKSSKVVYFYSICRATQLTKGCNKTIGPWLLTLCHNLSLDIPLRLASLLFISPSHKNTPKTFGFCLLWCWIFLFSICLPLPRFCGVRNKMLCTRTGFVPKQASHLPACVTDASNVRHGPWHVSQPACGFSTIFTGESFFHRIYFHTSSIAGWSCHKRFLLFCLL